MNAPIKPLPPRQISDAEIVKQIRELANSLPCGMCMLKGGEAIKSDGSCSHQPVTDPELIARITAVVSFFKTVTTTK